jgi:hypothetical protein
MSGLLGRIKRLELRHDDRWEPAWLQDPGENEREGRPREAYWRRMWHSDGTYEDQVIPTEAEFEAYRRGLGEGGPRAISIRYDDWPEGGDGEHTDEG